MFALDLSHSTQRFLKKQDKELARRILAKIELLTVDPFPHDVKRVVNQKEKVFRIRVGDYRVEYCVFYDRNLIFVTDIDKRSRIYD